MKKGLCKLAACVSVLALVLTTTSMSGSMSMASSTKKWEAKPLLVIKKAASSAPVGYVPSQIRKAYGLDQTTNTGAGKTIAIVDAYGSPTMQSDLAAFSTKFGIPQANLTIAYPTGKPSKSDGGWALETSMDVEWAHAVAPGANILLCAAKSASNSDLLAAEDYATSHGAQVVSNSWGGSESSSQSSYDSHFKHTGVTYLASSGDSGSGVEWPASSSYVVSVGGTLLNIDSTGTYQSEAGWTGSGGGKSSYVSRPSYQNTWSTIVGTKRGNPDISWDADPNSGVAVYDTTPDSGQTGWFQVGGTSLGSPCWAGMVALFDQNRTSPLTSFDLLTKLYNVAGTTKSSGYTTNFNDITSGSNGGYTAKSGFDLVTGIGSPKANTLVPYMNTVQ